MEYTQLSSEVRYLHTSRTTVYGNHATAEPRGNSGMIKDMYLLTNRVKFLETHPTSHPNIRDTSAVHSGFGRIHFQYLPAGSFRSISGYGQGYPNSGQLLLIESKIGQATISYTHTNGNFRIRVTRVARRHILANFQRPSCVAGSKPGNIHHLINTNADECVTPTSQMSCQWPTASKFIGQLYYWGFRLIDCGH
jgi:hypothetical protein